MQLLNLGDVLLSLGSDRKLIVWEEGVYETPKVGRGQFLHPSSCMLQS